MGRLLDSIQKTGDIKKIPPAYYPQLAAEIRTFLIQKVSENGGHLASNLGDVELTMGLHLALNLPEDKIVWDVGHQAYTHKILTGRKNRFDTLRQHGGLSGFPKRGESPCDSFNTGHASTSISAGLGMVKARDLRKETYTVVSVIGDGALTGGLAYEALNNAAKLDTNFIIVLNDNNRSISENVGGMSKYLNEIRTSEKYLDFRDKVYNSMRGRNPEAVARIRKAKNTFKSLFLPGMLFENLGITYLGPVDGNNVEDVRAAVQDAKRVRKAVVVHVITHKGRGYLPAERHPDRFHGTAPFDIATGLPKCRKTKAGYTDIFSTVMIKLAERDPRVVAITAAMSDGVGLRRFRNIYPDRFFDVGIAEEHAVTFAAGLATGGLRPVVAVYSTFLQRAYDEIVHDVCMQDLPVIFALDRAGLVGADGETHQGILDLSYLSSMPGMTVMAPKNKWELSDMLKFALSYEHPIAIRYPRGSACDEYREMRPAIEYGRSEIMYQGSDVLLIAVGAMVSTAVNVRKQLQEMNISTTVVNARFVSPVDGKMLQEEAPRHRLVVTLEDNEKSGGFGEHVESWMLEHDIHTGVLPIAIPDRYVEQGRVDELWEEMGMDADSVTKRILQKLKALENIR